MRPYAHGRPGTYGPYCLAATERSRGDGQDVARHLPARARRPWRGRSSAVRTIPPARRRVRQVRGYRRHRCNHHQRRLRPALPSPRRGAGDIYHDRHRRRRDRRPTWATATGRSGPGSAPVSCARSWYSPC
jgi:hypothetical protein